MKKQLLFFVMILLPMVASAHDIEVQNGDGVTIYYNYINNNTELAVTFRGDKFASYSNEYSGKVVIPEEVTYMNRTRKVTSIGNSTFNGCSSLTSVTIPNSVTSIGHGAFYKCTRLASVSIPNSLTNIGDLAFSDCSSLKKVIVSDIATWCNIKFGDSYANPLYYAHHLYSDENTEIKDLVIPNSVTSIGGLAFSRCTGFNTVSIGNGLKDIGDNAFYGCSGITSVTIPNSVTSIGFQAFCKCSSLTSVNIPNSVTNIGLGAFCECTSLVTAYIGNGVTSIYGGAFRDCTSLTSVSIGNGMTDIGSNAFYGCSGLTSITIPNSVTSIDIQAFYKCSSLTSVTIPNSVTSIGESAFYECTKLTSVTIGSGVTSIGNSAFDGVDIPTIISLIENPFTIQGKTSKDRTFTLNTFINATLYVPKGTIDKYKETDGWKDFVFVEEGNPTGINVVENTKNHNTSIYNLSGIRQPEPKKGINIINGKKVAIK